MNAASAVLFFILVAIGFTVTGIVGFGANVLMMPILSMVFPIQDLVLIFALISFVNASYRVVESRRGILWRPFARMVLISMSGTALGLWVFRLLPELWLKLLLGCFVVAMAVYHLAMHRRIAQWPGSHADSRVRHFLYQVLLFVGGFLQGSFVCGGAYVCDLLQLLLWQQSCAFSRHAVWHRFCQQCVDYAHQPLAWCLHKGVDCAECVGHCRPVGRVLHQRRFDETPS